MPVRRSLMLLDNEFSPDPRVAREIDVLLEAGWSVQLVCWDREARRAEHESPIPGLEVHRIRTPARRQLGARQLVNLGAFYRQVLRQRRTLLDADTVVVHCHDLLMLPLGVALAKGGRRGLLYDAHEIYWMMDAHRYPKVVQSVMRHTENTLVNRAVDAFLTVSHQRAREYWSEALNGPEVRVCGNWYDPVEVTAEERREARATLGVPDDTFCVVYAGSLNAARRVDLLASAVVGEDGLFALIAGRGARAGFVAGIARRADNVRFLGWVDDPWPLYRASDAIYYVLDETHPYARFSAPNNTSAALALERPLIVGRGGEPEALVRATRFGVVLAAQTPEAVRSAIRAVRDQPSSPPDLEGYRAMQQERSWRSAREGLLAAYDDATRSLK